MLLYVRSEAQSVMVGVRGIPDRYSVQSGVWLKRTSFRRGFDRGPLQHLSPTEPAMMLLDEGEGGGFADLFADVVDNNLKSDLYFLTVRVLIFLIFLGGDMFAHVFSFCLMGCLFRFAWFLLEPYQVVLIDPAVNVTIVCSMLST